MATGAGVDALTPRAARCVGTLDGPIGDCDSPPVVVLLCFGVIDEDGQALAAGELDLLEPVPVLFSTCLAHKRPLIEWARRLWGSYAEGTLFPIEALPRLVEKINSDGWPTAINPNPRDAYELVQTLARTAG